jgi:hypothetical protein
MSFGKFSIVRLWGNMGSNRKGEVYMFSFYFSLCVIETFYHSDLRTPRISSSLKSGTSCNGAHQGRGGDANQKGITPEHEQFFVVDLDLHAAVLWKQHLYIARQTRCQNDGWSGTNLVARFDTHGQKLA